MFFLTVSTARSLSSFLIAASCSFENLQCLNWDDSSYNGRRAGSDAGGGSPPAPPADERAPLVDVEVDAAPLDISMVGRVHG